MDIVTLSKQEHAMLLKNSELYLHLRDCKSPLAMIYVTNQVGDVLTGHRLDAAIAREKSIIAQNDLFNGEIPDENEDPIP
jgi:hypothetical protein